MVRNPEHHLFPGQAGVIRRAIRVTDKVMARATAVRAMVRVMIKVMEVMDKAVAEAPGLLVNPDPQVHQILKAPMA